MEATNAGREPEGTDATVIELDYQRKKKIAVDMLTKAAAEFLPKPLAGELARGVLNILTLASKKPDDEFDLRKMANEAAKASIEHRLKHNVAYKWPAKLPTRKRNELRHSLTAAFIVFSRLHGWIGQRKDD